MVCGKAVLGTFRARLETSFSFLYSEGLLLQGTSPVELFHCHLLMGQTMSPRMGAADKPLVPRITARNSLLRTLPSSSAPL